LNSESVLTLQGRNPVCLRIAKKALILEFEKKTGRTLDARPVQFHISPTVFASPFQDGCGR
jgi:hypothetical protein